MVPLITAPRRNFPLTAIRAPAGGREACYAGWAMTEKPIIQDPPPAPPRRAGPAAMRRVASADLVEPLKAHRRWLERGHAGGRRLHLESCDLTDVALQGALLVGPSWRTGPF